VVELSTLIEVRGSPRRAVTSSRVDSNLND
jgi:hypothetical protein